MKRFLRAAIVGGGIGLAIGIAGTNVTEHFWRFLLLAVFLNVLVIVDREFND